MRKAQHLPLVDAGGYVPAFCYPNHLFRLTGGDMYICKDKNVNQIKNNTIE